LAQQPQRQQGTTAHHGHASHAWQSLLLWMSIGCGACDVKPDFSIVYLREGCRRPPATSRIFHILLADAPEQLNLVNVMRAPLLLLSKCVQFLMQQ
jgi:hypothetical protein